MHIVFLDEFGHIGPFVSNDHEKHNTSPVFGVAGFMMHERHVRGFSSWFYNFKNSIYEEDIRKSEKNRHSWEKKGGEIFTEGRVYKTKRIGYSLVNTIKSHEGRIFYSGIEKYQNEEKSNPQGMYFTVLKHAIMGLEKYFSSIDENFMMIIDEHQSRKILLEGAIQQMYDRNASAKHLIQPPFQAESNLYQALQAADWLASIVGALCAFRCNSITHKNREWSEKYFGTRIAAASTHSRLRRSS